MSPVTRLFGCRFARSLALLFFLPLVTAGSGAADPNRAPLDLAELSLEELMSIEVISVSKKAERLSETAAAAYVITRDDIRRSGATTLADALRLAPGLQVARADAHKWTVTSRGFSGEFANKLLVLIDGRSVYTPLYSGVFWEIQDVMLEDIDRIEVIRGPGATLWGANAVNGVINIITHSAAETQGTVVEGGAGSEERGFGAFRYGTGIGDHTLLRVYGKYNDRGDFSTSDGASANDGFDLARGGFRIDRANPDAGTLTVQGDLYDGTTLEMHSVPALTPPYSQQIDDRSSISGGHLLARYSHDLSPTSALSLQLYYDQAARHNAYVWVDRNTVDFDLQHRFRVLGNLEAIWGVGYRLNGDRFDSTTVVQATELEQTDNLPSAFAQSEWALFGDRLHLIAGSKFEHNDYTGFEFQPNARLLWLPRDRHAAWAAVSRAVRTPSRFEHDVILPFVAYPPETPENPGPLPVILTANGNPEFGCEKLLAYEAGYRIMPSSRTSADLAVFYNVYTDLRGGEAGVAKVDSVPSYHVELPFYGTNDMEGETYGAELAFDWQTLDWLRLRTAYTYLHMDVHAVPGTGAMFFGGESGASPEHQVSVRTSVDLTYNVDWDLWVRYVDALPALEVPSYVELDARLAWRPLRAMELALVGQNLLHEQHPEFRSEIASTQIEVPRGGYASLTWRF